MSKSKVIRAWKDPAYRNSLSMAERAGLPANPAGGIEISDAELGKTAGGRKPLRTDLGPCPTQAGCTVNCSYAPACPTVFIECLSLTIC
jgi:mersacidin/lichenicidin family type 2 lantibiotic